MAAFGLTADDFAGEAVEIWPEHNDSFSLFCHLRTQWRTGANGPSGLDYAVMYTKFDRMGLSKADADQMEADIQTMESAALAEIHKPADK